MVIGALRVQHRKVGSPGMGFHVTAIPAFHSVGPTQYSSCPSCPLRVPVLPASAHIGFRWCVGGKGYPASSDSTVLVVEGGPSERNPQKLCATGLVDATAAASAVTAAAPALGWGCLMERAQIPHGSLLARRLLHRFHVWSSGRLLSCG